MSETDQKAREAGRSAQDHGKEVAGNARQQAGAVRDEATQHARDLVRQSGTQVKERADGQTKELASSLKGLSSELQSMADGSDRPDGALARLVGEGSTRLGSLSDRLETGGVDGAMDDVRRFGRERPGLFLGTCFAAGLLVGRALRNSDTSALTDSARSGAQGDTDASPDEIDQGRPTGSSTPSSSSTTPASSAPPVAPPADPPPVVIGDPGAPPPDGPATATPGDPLGRSTP